MKKDNEKEHNRHKIVGSLLRNDEALEKVIASGKNVVVDFSQCNFISVAGLEWLESMLLKAGSGKAKVNFVDIPPTLYKVFKVARIPSILDACGSPIVSSVNPNC